MALIADPRNDENLIVAQTHLAMIHFHNRVLDKLPASVPDTQRFTRARKKVSLHYQWLIRHDFLPRICSASVINDVFTGGRKLVEPGASPDSVPKMPVEFSVAAFRLGHSMVRPTYNWNRIFSGSGGLLDYMFQFSAVGGNLGSEIRLITSWIADFRRMYDFGAGGHPELAPASNVNRARRIDTRITVPLGNLPPSTFGGANSIPFDDRRRNLAFRNLTRGAMVKLASGQQMAAKLNSLGVSVTPLTKAEILGGNGGAELDELTASEKDALAANTPLWFYILREAELNGGQLTRRRGPDRRRDVPPGHRGQPVLDPARPDVAPEPRSQRHHVRDDGPAVLRVRGQEGRDQPARRQLTTREIRAPGSSAGILGGMAGDEAPPEVRALADARAAARRAKDWPTADALRAEIEAAGWKVVDAASLYTLERAAAPDVVESAASSATAPAPRCRRGWTRLRSGSRRSCSWRRTGPRTSPVPSARWPTASPDGTQIVVVGNAPSDDQAAALAELEAGAPGAPGIAIEVVWTSERLGHAAALNAGIRRSAAPVVVLVDTSLEPAGDLIGPLVAALDDPTVAVAGPFGLVSDDLRTFEEPPSGTVDVVAIEGYAQAFRRADYVARGPLDEHFAFYRNLDIWWSLVLRDPFAPTRTRPTTTAPRTPTGSSTSPPCRRRAGGHRGPADVVRHEHRGWTALPEAERDRLSKRNFYRILKPFATRRDLLLGGS